jgi:hypothetical protein
MTNEDPKSQLKSKTIIGAAIAILSGIAGIAGYTIAPEHQALMEQLILGVVSVVGGAMAWYGRFVAVAPIKRRSKGPGQDALVVWMLCGALLMLLAGCPGTMPDKPKNVLEQIEAAEITAQEVEGSIVNLMCTKYEGPRCIEPGKSLHPAKASELFAKVEEARKSLRTAAGLGLEGLGTCMGETRNQAACLSAARKVLLDIQTILLQPKGATQ